jgi:hypothetical protein
MSLHAPDTRQPDTTLPIAEFLGKSLNYSEKKCRV